LVTAAFALHSPAWVGSASALSDRAEIAVRVLRDELGENLNFIVGPRKQHERVKLCVRGRLPTSLCGTLSI
jgi:hypothetical protein